MHPKTIGALVNTPSGVNVSMSWLGENVRRIDLRSMELPALLKQHYWHLNTQGRHRVVGPPQETSK